MANKFQVKRTSVTGRTPNTTNSGNTHYIDTGELALNLADGKMFSSNGSVYFEVGANVANLSVAGNASIGAIVANGTIGSVGQTLTSNGTGIYWAAGAGTGTVTQVNTGNGLTGGPITATGTIDVVANNGIVANSTGVFANAGTGVVVNATGIHVNSTYIGTLAANSATYLGGNTASDLRSYSDTQAGAAYTNATAFAANATNISSGTLDASRLPATVVQNTDSRTLSGNLVISGTYFNPSSNTVLLGNSTQRWVVSANSVDAVSILVGSNLNINVTTVKIGNATFYANLQSTIMSVVGGSNGSYVNASMVLVSTTTGTSYYMGSGANLATSGTLNIGTANATANGFKANNNNISVGNSTVNVTVTTAGITSSGGTGVNPSSNSLGATLGTSTQRWIVNANTINASGLITASAGANIQGTANLVDVNISGNLTVSGTTTYVNTTNLNVGDNIVTLNADLTNLTAPTENAGLEINRGSSANVNFLWNETSDSWTLGNTDITGYANASVSVNSALLTVGTSFIANTQGAYHTGTVNAASHTTSGITANTSGVYPSSNTVGTALGTTTNRWNLTANAAGFTGQVEVDDAWDTADGAGAIYLDGLTGNRIDWNINGVAAPAVTTRSAGTKLVLYPAVAAASVDFGLGIETNHMWFSVADTGDGFKWYANTTQLAVANTSGFTLGSGGIFPTSNSSATSLGSATQRWVLNANTGSFSGAVSGITTLAAGNTTITGFANVTSTIQGGSSLTIAGAASGITTLAAGNTTVTGFANITSTIQGGSSLTIAGAASGITTLAAGNTTITGFANASVSVNSALLTVGTNFVANTTGAYHTGTVNAVSFTTTNFIANTTGAYPLSNTAGTALGSATQRWVLNANTGSFAGAVSGITTLAAGNTTITGFANASVSVNSALLTVGTSFIANTTGAYHTGTVNAASFTTTNFIANTTGSYPLSNSAGTALGSSTQRWVLNANTISASGLINGSSGLIITGTANVSVAFNLGSSFIANTTGAYHTGLVNAASLDIGSSGFIANSTAIVLGEPVTANGTTGTSGQVLTSNGTVGTPYWSTVSAGGTVTVVDDTSTNGTRYIAFANQTSGTLSSAYVDSTGLTFNPSTGTVAAAIFSATSDERLKSDIKIVGDPVEKIKSLKGVNFTYAASNTRSIGVIAQDVELQMPELVDINSEGYRQVNYNGIIGVLIEAVKQQQKEIDGLKQMVERLK